MGHDWEKDLVAAVDPFALVVALGPGWVSTADALPWGDRWSALQYVVYSPSYCGDLLLCRFQLHGATEWWDEHLQVGISGVTHWRIAQDHELQSITPACGLPESIVSGDALTQLKRWWMWYCAHRGIKRPDQ